MNKRRAFLLIILLLLGTIAAACGAERANTAGDRAEEWPAPQPSMAPMAPVEVEGVADEDQAARSSRGYAAGLPQATDLPDRMVIQSGYLFLVVDDVEETLPLVQHLVDRLEGYISQSTSYRTTTDRLEATVVLRVPAERFSEALDELRGLAYQVSREDLSGEDVTDQYVDLQARLSALQATEEQLLALLAEVRESYGNAQEKAQAILAIYEQITVYRSQIEQIQGQMQYFEQMSAMAAITVDLRPRDPEIEQPVVEEGFDAGRIFRQAARSLVSIFQGIAAFLINVAVVVLPLVAIIAIPAGIVTWWVRRRVKTVK